MKGLSVLAGRTITVRGQVARIKRVKRERGRLPKLPHVVLRINYISIT